MTEFASPEVIKRRLDRNAELIAELEAHKQATTQQHPLLVAVARIVQHYDWAGTHAVPSSVIGDGGRTKPSSKPPGSSGDRQVRWAFKGFQTDVERLVDRYWLQSTGEYKKVEYTAPKPDENGRVDRLPRVRCGACRKRQPAALLNADMTVFVVTECVQCQAPIGDKTFTK